MLNANRGAPQEGPLLCDPGWVSSQSQWREGASGANDGNNDMGEKNKFAHVV